MFFDHLVERIAGDDGDVMDSGTVFVKPCLVGAFRDWLDQFEFKAVDIAESAFVQKLTGFSIYGESREFF